MLEDIPRCEEFTDKKLLEIRSDLASILKRQNYAIVAGGSYARREASDESDLDYFIVCDSRQAKRQAQKDLPTIRRVIKKFVRKAYAAGGAFGQIEIVDDMAKNIGGTYDTNEKITRRVLFLLEGEWLYNKSRFMQYRNLIISKYIKSKISDHQFCRFLLNDLIRYYRTICVDFEHKTSEGGKAWGTRNIKLVFSRKLLYFSGILVAAETWQHTYETKLRIAKALLTLTPIQRVQKICGPRAESVLAVYGDFLRKMGDPSVRAMTDKVSDIRDRQPKAFRLFKNQGHHFSWMLTKLLRDTYDTSHPIHNALIV